MIQYLLTTPDNMKFHINSDTQICDKQKVTSLA
jgi:hypothetical protein